jgi:hypothetical protein
MLDSRQDTRLLLRWKPKKVTAHEVETAELDVSALRDGRSAIGTAKPYRGRPHLAGQMYEAMQTCARRTRPQQSTIGVMYADIIPFFRFLDEMEDASHANGTRFPSVEGVWQVPGQIWSLFTEWLKGQGNDRAHFIYSTCKRLFRVAAHASNVHQLEYYLPPNPFRNPQKNRNSGANTKADQADPTLDDLRVLTGTLRAQMELTEARFAKVRRLLAGEESLDPQPDMTKVGWPERFQAVDEAMARIAANISAGKGFYPRNLSGLEVYRNAGFDRSKPLWKSPSLDIMRARVREFVDKTKGQILHVCPWNDEYEWHIWGPHLEALEGLGESKSWSVVDMQAGSGVYYTIGDASPATVQQITEGLHAFVPRQNDLRAAIGLFLLHSGWNISTALDLDATNWWRPHPTHPDILAQIFAPKVRAKGRIQHAYSLKSKAFRPFDIIQRVLRWTEPLRASLQQRLAVLEKMLLEDPTNELLQSEREYIASIVKRVWLFVNLDGRIVAAAKQDMRWSWVNLLFKQAGVEVDGAPVQFTQSLTRKSFAVFVYETSGYNLIVTQVALGHKDFSSLLAYLDRKRIRTANRRSWFHLQVEVLKGLEAGALMSTLLAKKLRKGSISEEEVHALEQRSARTRQGFACADPMNPDKKADPGHRDGQVCREQRCLTGCSKAFATWDTAQWLALYVLELRRRRDQTPFPLWSESDDDIDLRVAEDLLSCYSDANQKRAFAWAHRKIQQRPVLVTLPGLGALRAAGMRYAV